MWATAEEPKKKEVDMGGEPYEYVVDYESNVQAALEKLRQQVFASGKYNGAERKPRSPEHALELAGADGTASILDIERVADEPDYGVASPLTAEEYDRYFGTDKPGVDQIRECDDLWEDLERGQARYVLAYEGSAPSKIVFLGYSFD
jgi:hypothetical protein